MFEGRCWNRPLGFSRETGCVGMNPKDIRRISFRCITSWVFGERVDVSIRSGFSSYWRILFSQLSFSPLVSLKASLIYARALRENYVMVRNLCALRGVVDGKPFFSSFIFVEKCF